MKKDNYKRLGDYIEKVNVRNTENLDIPLMGLTIDKKFIPSVANTIGTDLTKYKVVYKNQFACSLMQVSRDGKMPIARLDEEKVIMSPAYPIFEVIKPEELLPEYLEMWFKRAEFDREAAYYAVGGVRGNLTWEDFCDLTLPIPSLEKQQEIVADYQAVEQKIKTNEAICEKLEETAQTIYRRWFEEFEFFCLPSDYRPHGQINSKLSVEELRNEITKICTYKKTGGLPISGGKKWFIYLLLCEDDSIYKGMTNDLYRRFYEHYTGIGADWTKAHKPIKVIHWEEFDSKEEAAKREKELKTGYGRTWIQRQIEKAGGFEALKSGLLASKAESSSKTNLPAPKTIGSSKTSLSAPKTKGSSKTSLPAPKTKLRMAGKMVWNEELEKEVPEGWEVKKLGDILRKNGYIRGPFGSALRVGEMLKKGVPVYEQQHAIEGHRNFRYFISKGKHITLKRFTVQKKDFIVSCSGTIGKVTIISEDDPIGIINQALLILRVNPNLYPLNIFRTFITSPFGQSQLLKDSGGSAQVNIAKKSKITSIPIIISDAKLLYVAENKFYKLFCLIKKTIQENEQLLQLQSLLLARMTREEKIEVKI